jgi:hypothetical protein
MCANAFDALVSQVLRLLFPEDLFSYQTTPGGFVVLYTILLKWPNGFSRVECGVVILFCGLFSIEY